MSPIKRLLTRLTTRPYLYALYDRVDETKMLAARILINQIRQHGIYANLRETEFKVFSQFGDDGIIQYLIQNIDIDPDHESFIEFGVENYTESNTRFLLTNNNWRGLVIEADPAAVEYIKRDPVCWKHSLTVVNSFITRENINQLIEKNDFNGEIGLLSIDIDGNDYWVWDAINVVKPIIVVIEYNSVFGKRRAVTIPYDPAFRRERSHSSHLFWGCSLPALTLFADKNNYGFIGCNSAGNNAYFIRRDKLGRLPTTTTELGYVVSRFRESRDASGSLTYLSGKDRLKAIEDMSVYDLETEALVKLRDLQSPADFNEFDVKY